MDKIEMKINFQSEKEEIDENFLIIIEEVSKNSVHKTQLIDYLISKYEVYVIWRNKEYREPNILGIESAKLRGLMIVRELQTRILEGNV